MKFKILLLALIASAANAQTISKNTDSPDDLKTAQSLIERHFKIFNETNEEKRLKQFPDVYLPSIFMGDYGGAATGFQELNTLLKRIQTEHSGFEFRPDAVTMNHGLGRVAWWYGPKQNPHTVRGEDIFTVENGKLSTLRVYIDSKSGDKK